MFLVARRHIPDNRLAALIHMIMLDPHTERRADVAGSSYKARPLARLAQDEESRRASNAAVGGGGLGSMSIPGPNRRRTHRRCNASSRNF